MNKSPYTELKNLKCWNIIENAMNDLVQNNDLIEQTSKEYIVGYIVQCILEYYPSLNT